MFIQFIDGDCSLADGWTEKSIAFLTKRDDTPLYAVGDGASPRSYNIQLPLRFGMEYANRRGDGLRGRRLGASRSIRSGKRISVGFDCWGGARTLPSVASKRMENLAPRCGDDRARRGNDAVAAVVDSFSQNRIRVRKCFMVAPKCAPRNLEVGDLAGDILGRSLPAAIVAGALIHPVVILGISIYVIQVCRMVLRDGPITWRSGGRATLITLSKFAEFKGILKFVWQYRQQRAPQLIEYK